MKYVENKVEDLKIAYIGGGSRQWARHLMRDLALTDDLSGEIRLYDIDYEAALLNEKIGNGVKNIDGCLSVWSYRACKTLEESLVGADFVFISITPGSLDAMESDAHTPEKYGIYQSVADTTGPAGVIRSLRAIPMVQEIALAVKKCCPDAWVINYSNPMTVFTKALYASWPEIKAFGCCHEVFGTQKLLALALDECRGIKGVKRTEIKTEVTGVNHFTWVTSAKYKNIDLLEVFEEYMAKYAETGVTNGRDDNWLNRHFECAHLVKFDLFRRLGAIPAAADRHIAEFCPRDWYLASPERVARWKFGLTPVSWRKKALADANEETKKIASGEKEMTLWHSGEEEIAQMRALLGLEDLVTNVNLINHGQIPDLPLGACVETNAIFTADRVQPVYTGPLPPKVYPLVSRIVGEQQLIVEAGMERDLEKAFEAFMMDPLVTLPQEEARRLFDEMVENTKEYLGDYFK